MCYFWHVNKVIIFSRHSELKLFLLRRHGFKVAKHDVEETLKIPTRVYAGYEGRKIAEREITQRHVLRVVFEESSKEIKVITYYDVSSTKGAL